MLFSICFLGQGDLYKMMKIYETNIKLSKKDADFAWHTARIMLPRFHAFGWSSHAMFTHGRLNQENIHSQFFVQTIIISACSFYTCTNRSRALKSSSLLMRIIFAKQGTSRTHLSFKGFPSEEVAKCAAVKCNPAALSFTRRVA